MRHILVVILAVLCLASYAVAEDTAVGSAVLTPVRKAGETLRYNVKVRATGNTTLPGASNPVPIDTIMDLVIAYKVGEIAADGSTQLTIVAEKASATVAGQKMEIPTSIFPKTITLVDKNGEVTKFFAPATSELKMPGLNSKNLILLFITNAPAGDVKVGSTWKKLMSLQPEPEKYDLSYKLEALESIGKNDTARVRADLSVLPPPETDYSANGFVITNYSLDGCKLIKSHAEMSVKINNANQQQSSGKTSDAPTQMEAKILIDMQQIATP